jgi:hypothetical protein
MLVAGHPDPMVVLPAELGWSGMRKEAQRLLRAAADLRIGGTSASAYRGHDRGLAADGPWARPTYGEGAHLEIEKGGESCLEH